MLAGHTTQTKRRSGENLRTIFEQALAQPAHIAIKRIKYAFAFDKIDDDMGSIIQAAFKGTSQNPLRINLVGRFIAGTVGFGSDATYWRHNILEDYIDHRDDLKIHRGELIKALKEALDSQPSSYTGTDAKKIIAYFEDYSNS